MDSHILTSFFYKTKFWATYLNLYQPYKKIFYYFFNSTSLHFPRSCHHFTEQGEKKKKETALQKSETPPRWAWNQPQIPLIAQSFFQFSILTLLNF